MTSYPKLEIKNLKKSFKDKEVLRDISFELNTGEIISIVGESGSGKSTIFNIIAGFLMPDSGLVSLYGRSIIGVKGEVSYMLQDDLLLPHMTIEENIILPLILNGTKKDEAIEEISPYFKDFGLSGTEKDFPKTLSGGMRQRAALFRTVMNRKEIILLDEPFNRLDKMTKDSLHRYFLEISSKHTLSSIFITHDMEEAIFLSDRVLVLKDGTISDEIEIERSRPRDYDFYFTNEFLEYHRRISEALKNRPQKGLLRL